MSRFASTNRYAAEKTNDLVGAFWNILHRNRTVRCLLVILVSIALIKGILGLSEIIFLEASGAVDVDYLIYTIVGRGILNGLKPYVDLFESKPPGMFLFAAISLLITGNEWFAIAVEIGTLLLTPIILAIFALKESHGKATIRRFTIAAVSLLLGILLMLFAEERAGALQTELFGTFFASLYTLSILWYRKGASKVLIIVRSLLLLCVIGLKEPFILTTFAAALLLSSSTKNFLQIFIAPLLVALSIGTFTLLFFGYLHTYLSIYLPAMLGHRITHDPTEPFFVRGFSIAKVLYNIAGANTVHENRHRFGVIIAILWSVFPILRTYKENVQNLLLVTVGAVLSYFLLRSIWVLLVLLYAIGFYHPTLDIPFILWKLTGLIALVSILGIILFLQRQRGLAGSTLLAIASTYPVAAAVGIGGYSVNHPVLAGPVYFALILLFIRYVSTTNRPPLILGIVTATTLLSVFFYRIDPRHVAILRDQIQLSSAVTTHLARRLDGMLDSCRFERYSLFGNHRSFAFAKHSPIGPLFISGSHSYLGENHFLHQSTYENIRHGAQVIFLDNTYVPAQMEKYFQETFTEKSPLCAEKFLPLPNIKAYFRKL